MNRKPIAKPAAPNTAKKKPAGARPSGVKSAAAQSTSKAPIRDAVADAPEAVEAVEETVDAPTDLESTDAATNVAESTPSEDEPAVATTDDAVDAADVDSDEPADSTLPDTADHQVVPRLTVPRLTLPKLSLPKFSTGRAVVEDAPAPAETEGADGSAIADEVASSVVSEPEAAPAEDASEIEPVESTDPVELADAGSDVAEPEEVEPSAEKPADAEPSAEKPADAEPSAGEPDEVESDDEPVADESALGTEAQPEEPEADLPAVADAAAEEREPEPAAATTPEAATSAVVEPAARPSRAASDVVLLVHDLTKRFDDTVAVNSIELEVKVGAFYGIVGPNGAGKTTTLSMITGLLRPDSGTISVHGADVWSDPVVAKRNMGVLPDRLRLFDRLTGAQVLYYAGVLRGLDEKTVRTRTADLAGAFGLTDALGRLVTDYSAGMTKKIALAAAMIHSPRLLVLDEPFESVDPVSSATITDILKKYAKAGGTVVLSSHSMDLVQRICDHVAVIVGGVILADGTMKEVRGKQTLEERFVDLAGGRQTVEGLEWLHSFSD